MSRTLRETAEGALDPLTMAYDNRVIPLARGLLAALDALQQIVDYPVTPDTDGGNAFADVRQIARAAVDV